MRVPASLLLPALLAGCAGPPDELSALRPGAALLLGDEAFVRPLPGLGEPQLAAFRRGRTLFDKTFTPETGLGPLYNNTSCRACHGVPASGGGSPELLTLIAGEFAGAALTLREDGGPVISDKAIQGIAIELMPLEAKAISKRISPPTYGEGLIEAIPARAILARLGADPRRQALGIRGRANWEPTQLGRFGWKAQTGDMVTFSVTAANFEMGLSSPQRPHEFFPNMLPQKVAAPAAYGQNPMVTRYFDARGEAARKPDLTAAEVDDLAAFQRYQAPPAPLPMTGQAKAGGEAFARVGCAECHVPAYKTGPNQLAIPPDMDVPLYSDLLLHDMGPDGSDGIRWQGSAGGADWRTPPLWGLRYRLRLMHDGRAASIEEAIQAHGGEATKVVATYNGLDPGTKDAMRAFLMAI